MPGASLSRWTLTYFACALVCLLAAESLMVIGFGFPGAAIDAAETLILVQFDAIGRLSLLMCGALFQFVPVLVARPLLGEALPPVALAAILLGLLALLAGFAGMSELIAVPPEMLPLGGLLLVAGFGTVMLSLGRTLWEACSRSPTSRPTPNATRCSMCVTKPSSSSDTFLAPSTCRSEAAVSGSRHSCWFGASNGDREGRREIGRRGGSVANHWACYRDMVGGRHNGWFASRGGSR